MLTNKSKRAKDAYTSPFLWPHIIGHRGSAGTAPENTLISFREAYEGGVKAVEFDVMLTKDGVPMVFHDDTLERLTNGTGYVWDNTADELKQLDAGSKFLNRFTGEPIPTFEAVLKLTRELGLLINIEIKPAPGKDVETAEAALSMTDALWPSHAPKPLISSFNIKCLERALALKPDWPRGLLMHKRLPNWRLLADHVNATTLNVNEKLPAQFLSELIASGLPVFAYTINDVKRARSLFDLGIAGIFTDYPAQMLRSNLRSFN